MEERIRLVSSVADAIHAEGLAGLMTTLPRMIGPGSDIFGCVSDADFCMGDAGTADEIWDCAIDMATCIQETKFDEEPELPPDDDHPVPPDEDDPRWPRDLGTLTLAVLLFQLRRDRGYRSGSVRQQR